MSKILIVDDEKKIREIYRKLLEFEKYEVLEAADATAASKLLIGDEDIRLILLDINMPQINGGTLYRMIRILDPKTRVIVTSAYPLEDQKQMIARADDYYDKSQGMDILLDKIKKLFEKEENHAY